MSNVKKVYGLILPQKDTKPKPVIKKSSVFADDDEDDEDNEGSNKSRQLLKGTSTKNAAKNVFIKKQVQLDIEKALAQDPNAFDYDAVYDEVQSKKIERSAAEKSNVERKPKFIHSLLKAADQRKKEEERRIERTVQREREAEKGLYDDKEAFVTESFRKKMREMKEEEEREQKKKEMEELNDVTKTGDYSTFYRNLLNRKTGQSEKSDKKEKQSTGGTPDLSKKNTIKYHDDNRSDDSADRHDSKHSQPSSYQRFPREEGQRQSTRKHSVDSDSDNDETRHPKKKPKEARDEARHVSPVEDIHHFAGDTDVSMSDSSSSDEEASEADDAKSAPVLTSESSLNVMSSSSADSKKSIFDKKTVGDALNDARARYLARKGAMKAAISNDD